MSSNPNKAKNLAAMITLLAACAISSSAQTHAAVYGLRTKPASIPRTGAAASERRQPAEDTVTAGADRVAEDTSDLEASDHVRRTDSGTTVASSVAAESREKAGRATTAAPQPAATDTWQFQLTPYLWIPTINGRAGIGNLVTDTSVSVGNAKVELNFGFMGTFEARKNKLIILTDLQYSDIATEKGNPGPLFSSSRASFKTFVFDPEVGYRILNNGKGATLDVLGGLRYWHLNADLAFRAGFLPAVEVTRSRSWVDGVVGLRGRAALSPRWFVVGKADLGGGGSKFTYQLFGGVGVNVGKRFALVGGYRDLNVNYDKDGFLFDMSLHGPILGIGMKF
jgi:hypothetical protein